MVSESPNIDHFSQNNSWKHLLWLFFIRQTFTRYTYYLRLIALRILAKVITDNNMCCRFLLEGA